ncbi:rRNA maturation RNase YbeY [Christiangramia sp. OXR-203]|uniref:rRNA maturation RNase YbeY n=1 Tax=Christiangramia sp. OXR-203 TaxID=3100176 RepID=UPI002AC9BE69|nr:rRNA maturation RNase YbeY [Christiangramia sp. OXR-203]WPY98738.1 rRNA maturation RNase YbeY [Christiangramia sp. OXR-203]
MVKGTINFFNENDFSLKDEELFQNWLFRLAESELKNVGEINYIFCDDEYLLEINQNYLDHDTYTDIISFDNTVGNSLNGDIFISTERVEENAAEYNVDFLQELKRVIAHGMLHLCGYKDKLESESELMRRKEDEKIEMFHVEQS